MSSSSRPVIDAPLARGTPAKDHAPERAPLDAISARPTAGETIGQATIGQAGGIVRAGTHILVVPPFALDFPATITLRAQPQGTVTVEPEGLEFAVPACLVRGYGERAPQLSFLRSLRAGEMTGEPEALPSLDTRHYTRVFDSLRCASSYMAAE